VLEQGLVALKSSFDVKVTIGRLEAALTAKGITVFARIDHAKGASEVGMLLRPTELLIFGSPKAGTPLMQREQTAGIDLPLKMLGWQDELGQVWLAYDDPAWIAQRHGLGADAQSIVAALARTLAELAKIAIE
jgi:uncharacterized protein (DUF302 family)